MSSWLKKAIFYQIYPNSFKDTNDDGIGDIKGIISKIPYLLDLGINALWINPIFVSPFKDGGYDVKDYFNIDTRFGTMSDFKHLLKIAHENNLKIIIDLVPGHTSDEHPFFIKSMAAKRNKYSDFYVYTNSWWDSPCEYRFISGKATRDGNYLINFFSMQPALNYGFNKITHNFQIHYLDERLLPVFNYLVKIIKYWIDIGVDGFRVDMADSLVKNDDNKDATAFIWQKVFSIVRPYANEVVFISEWSGTHAITKAGFDCDFMLNHPHNPYSQLLRLEFENGHSVFDPNGLGNPKKYVHDYLNWYTQIKGLGLLGNITCNHDFPRLSPMYSQRQLKIIIPYLIFLPGVFFLYYGDEIGQKFIPNMVSVEGGFSRTGTRIPMYWDHSKNYGFSSHQPFIKQNKSSNTVQDQMSKLDSLWWVVKKAIKLRKDYFDFESDNIEFITDFYPLIIKRNNLIIIVNPLNSEIPFDYDLSEYKEIFKVGSINSSTIKKITLVVYSK